MISANSEPKFIAMVQRALFAAKFGGNMDETKLGSWGKNTDDAVKAFKKANGITEDSLMNTVALCTLLNSLSDEVEARDVESANDKAAIEDMVAIGNGRL